MSKFKNQSIKIRIIKLIYVLTYCPLKAKIKPLVERFCYYLYSKGVNVNNSQIKLAYNYAISNLSFSDAFKIKKKWMWSLINQQENSIDLKLEPLKAALELGEFYTARRWIEDKKTSYLDFNLLSEIKSFVYLHLGSFEYWNNWASSVSCLEDFSARVKLNSSKVLFLGPAPDSDVNLIKSENVDYVALINYTRRTLLDIKGADLISYYNGQRLIEELDIILDSSYEVSMVFPKPTTLGLFEKAPLIHSKILRGSRSPSNVMCTDREPNNFQYGLYDLIFLGVRDLSVTGFNFWCSKRAWAEGYKPDNYAHYERLSNSVRAQDPLSNFLFVKNLHKNKLINLGFDTSSIVALDIEEYGKILDDFYPHHQKSD
jgi:hypothetical protein